MNFDLPPLEFSENEIKRINDNYILYLSELNNSEKRNEFIKERQTYNEGLIQFRSNCYIVFCFSLYNLLLAIISLTILKSADIFELIIGTTLTFFIPIIYYSICQSIYEAITKNRDKKIKEEIDNLSKLYEKILYEQYEKYIENYFKIQAYNVEVEERKEENKISMIQKLSKMDKKEFKQTIKNLLEYEGMNISNVDIEDCLLKKGNNDKALILCKHIKRSISIADVKRFEEKIEENGFDYGMIYYTGDISTPAVEYCSNRRVLIYLYNEFDISDRINKMENSKFKDKNTKKEQSKLNVLIESNYNNKCPWCGGRLVERKSNSIQFIGCSNFPRCHYIRKIK